MNGTPYCQTLVMKKTIALFTTLYLLLTPLHAQYKTYHGDGIDDYLRFVPVVATFGMKAAGVESRSSWKGLIVNTAVSYAIVCGTTWALKASIHETRPDGTDRHSFPSGHTSAAFAGATIIHKEYAHLLPWISVGGYAVATAVAIDRVCRNRHDWDDVAVGALIGIGGTELGYWIGRKLLPEKKNYAFAINGNSISMALNF